MRFRIFLLALLLCGFYGFGCGGAISDVAPDPDIADIEPQDSVERLILSEYYAGKLVIRLEDRDISVLNHFSSEGLSYSRAIGEDLNRYYERKDELERLSRRELPDLSKYYFLEVKDPRKAIDAYRNLKNRRGVELVYAEEIPQPLGLTTIAVAKDVPQPLGLETTPDLSGVQGYLKSYSRHGGVDAEYAWQQGITGQDVILVDGEQDWDFAHLDVTYDSSIFVTNGLCDNPESTSSVCRSIMNHGTAVAGVITGKHQETSIGVKGIAPDLKFNAGSSSISYFLAALTDGDPSNYEMPPGTIFLIEIGRACNSQAACLPMEVSLFDFTAIQQATAAGITVISGAANGSKNLDVPSDYESLLPSDQIVDLSQNDSGSILVGASQGVGWPPVYVDGCQNGGAHTLLNESNYGTPVDLFAWGCSVVTAGYGYPGNPYEWFPISGWPTPPNSDPHAYFMNSFGGTSSATAIVGGAAALLQSYAKREMGEPETRYLMPSAIKNLLYSSGHPQAGSGGNIGRQPDVPSAFAAFDSYWNQIKSSYPKIDPDWDGDKLTEEEMIDLRAAGVGIICGKVDVKKHQLVGLDDPACPARGESEFWPADNYRAKNLDFDGDGRADLVQWTNGTLKIDFSSMVNGEYAHDSGEDNFGAWDLELEYDPVPGRWAVSHVEDINKDGRADLVIYAREVGKWYIYYTDLAMIEDGVIEQNPENWDLVLDYSAQWHDDRTMDPFGTDDEIPDTRYSRPHLADYNGDGHIDIGIACSDGYWRIDYATGAGEGYGSYDSELRYLLPEQLELAPGWAYLTATSVIGGTVQSPYNLTIKHPDSIGFDGSVAMLLVADIASGVVENLMSITPPVFGGSDVLLIEGNYWGAGRYSDRHGIKDSGGSWNFSNCAIKSAIEGYYCSNFEIFDVAPNGEFGGPECLPVLADFDGNGVRDRAVMCPDEWRIAYYHDQYFSHYSPNFLDQLAPDGMRYVELGYDEGITSLPGISHAGGRQYSQVKSIIKMQQLLSPDTPPAIPVDVYLK